jgi:hypothetical protein
MLGGERIAVHLISDQGVRLEARDREILDISVDANSVEFAEIRARGQTYSARGVTRQSASRSASRTPPQVMLQTRRVGSNGRNGLPAH